MAWNQLGGWLPWFWLSAVTLILAIRWKVLGSLPAAASSSERQAPGRGAAERHQWHRPGRIHRLCSVARHPGACGAHHRSAGPLRGFGRDHRRISACVRGVRRANDLAAEHHVGDRSAGRSTPMGGILHRGAHPRFRNGVAVARRRRVPPPQGILPDQAGPSGPQPAASSCARRRRGGQPRQDTLSGVGEPRPASTDAYDLAVQCRTGDAAAGRARPARSRFTWTRPCRR